MRCEELVAAEQVKLVDVAAESGVHLRNRTGSAEQWAIVGSLSGGAAFIDYDGDGWLDLYLVNGSVQGADRGFLAKTGEAPRNALYRNLGDGRFEDVTEAAGVGDRGWGMGVVAFDYDGDGWTDLFITNWGADVLYRNRGDGTFADVTVASGVGDDRWGAGGAAADYDGDGDLDLFVACHVAFSFARPPNGGEFCLGYRGLRVYCGPQGLPPQRDILYQNNGDGTFSDVSEAVGVGFARYSLGGLWTDYDDDGDPDLLVAVDSQPNLLYRNDGPWPGGRFTESALLAGVAYSGDGHPQAGMGVAAGDYDGDGLMDLYLTHFSDDSNTLYHNDGGGYFTDVTWSVGLAGVSIQHLGWGTSFTDFDNDGYPDLFVSNGHIFPQVDAPDVGLSYAQPNQLFLQRAGRFVEVSESVGLGDRRVGRGAAFGDYDNDGDIDVLVINLNDTPTLLRNEAPNTGHFLKVALQASGDGYSGNPTGVGARVAVSRGNRRWVQEVRRGESYLCTNDPRLHFGLGDSDKVRVEIRWPDGRTQVVQDVSPGGLLIVSSQGSHRFVPMRVRQGEVGGNPAP